jgi:hypothetical protein
MKRIKLPQLGIVIVVCALVGALAGIAGSAAAPSKSKKSSQATPRFAPRHMGLRGPGGPGFGPGGGPGGPAVHGEVVVPNKAGNGFITITTDGGTIKSISGNDITIDESVGTLHYKDATVTIPSDATVVRDHAKASVSDLKEGDFVRVIASSERTIVIAEDATFQKQERKRFRGFFRGRGHFGPPPGGPPPGAPAPQGSSGTY